MPSSTSRVKLLIGLRVRALRIANGLTQNGLAERIGATREWVHLAERGQFNDFAKVVAISLSFNVSHATLFDDLEMDPNDNIAVHKHVAKHL